MPFKATRVIRVFVIIIVAIAASALLYLLVNNFQFRRGTSVRVHFASVGDLNSGAWVRKAGIKVGSVTRLEPAEDEKTVIVTLTFKPGQIVRSTDKFSLVAKGILGDMYMEQKPGPKDSPFAQEDQLFEGQQSFSLTDLLGGDTMSMVTDLAGGLKGLIDILKKNESEIDSTMKDISLTAHNLRVVTDRAVVLTDSVPQIAQQINSSMFQMQAAVTEVADTTHRLVAKLEKNLDSSTDDLAASMKSVRASTADIQKAITALTAQNTVISKLSAPDTGQSLDATVKNLQAVSQELLTVTKETRKVIEGVSVIFENK
ncbi:MAG: MlaD family protein [Spirochaetia bacterium]|jgi:phospholipid/cholesterol/gamma-HCH transport system substrate-binding protein